MANIKINGQWLTDHGAFGELKWSSKHRGGCEAASWQVDSLRRLPFRPGQLVEVLDNGWPVFAGTLLEPDGDRMHARGLYYQGEAAALDSAGNATVNPDVALFAAIITRQMLNWVQPVSLLNADFGTVSGVTTVIALLTAWAESVGKVIRVDARRRVTAVTPATTPRWYVAPGSAQLTVAQDTYATHLIGRYLDSATGTYKTVPATNSRAATAFGPREQTVDLAASGLAIDTAQATAILQTRLAEASRPGWANALQLASWELTTAGDAPANLRSVQGGDLIRITGQMDTTIATGPLPYIDVIADEVTYVDGSDVIDIKPVGLEVRSVKALFASVVG